MVVPSTTGGRASLKPHPQHRRQIASLAQELLASFQSRLRQAARSHAGWPLGRHTQGFN